MKKIQLLLSLFLILFVPFKGFLTTIHVPATFTTIQAAIDGSVNGDTVLVDPGTYFEHINLNGHNIVLCSWFVTTGNAAYIAGTIIDGSNTDRVVTVNQGEDTTCMIAGFTIQHGSAPLENNQTFGGGGIFILDSSPRVLYCTIQNNYAVGYGGGLCLTGYFSVAKVTNCTIQNNTADSFGGGVFMGDCSTDAVIANCIISGNSITCNCNWNGGGGGVNLFHTGKLENCLVTGNSAPNSSLGGGGIHCDWGDYYGSQGIFVTGCTITNNTASSNGGVSYVITGGEFRNCIIWGNTNGDFMVSNYDGNTFVNCCTDPLPSGTGNISSDPAFVNSASTNFRLTAGSPCIGAGNNSFNDQSKDLDGNPRVMGVIDMGAYEKLTTSTLTVEVGSGADSSEQFPIYSYYGYNYSQQIYLGSEITSGGVSPGNITKIRFFYVSGDQNFDAWHDWTVYLGNTTKTEFTDNTDWVPVSSMTQVFSGIIPNPVNGTWIELTLPVPFYYSGDNVVVAVDENSAGWNDPVHWGSFDAGTPRGLLFFDDNVNPDPASPPIANNYPDNLIARIQFDITPGYGLLEGYITEAPGCIDPVEGATVTAGTYSATANSAGFYQLNLPIGTYFDVTAHHGDISQTITPVLITAGNTTTLNFCLQPYFPPPVGLQATVTGTNQNNVHLTWLAPGSIADQWIHWDNGTMYGGLGYYGPATFSVASRWPVADIAPYNGTYLKKIRFVPGDAFSSYTLKVWKGADASTLLLSQVVDNPLISAWNEITLDTPIMIDGTQEFWFGYEIVQTQTGYPAGLGSGPAIVRKGDMINSGYGWFSVKEVWGWEFNWTIQGFVSENAMLAPNQVIPMVQHEVPQPAVMNPQAMSIKPCIMKFDLNPNGMAPPADMTGGAAEAQQASITSDAPSILTGYNVYRDNAILASNVTGLSYDDLALPKGGYDYEVSAQYDNGESAKIGPVHVDIYTCFPPTGLSVSNASLTTTTANLSWTPSTISLNPEWTLEWGLEGFIRGTGTTVHITTTPQYSLSNLLPGTQYDFYVSTYCNATDASAWVRKTFRTHYFNCPAGATAEAETCGTNTNGCDLVPPAFESISCGQTICGTAWLSRTHRDSDWYTFTLTEPNDVTLTGNAEFSYFIGIGSAPCPSALFYTSTNTGAGYNSSITTQLVSAGTYYVNVAPSFSEQVVCDSLSRYWVKLSCNNCLTPTNLSATNITSNSADLGWTSTAGMWNIEWGLAGFTQGTGTMITGTGSNPYQLTGLTVGHYYSFYVQSDCGAGSTSSWAGPYSFYLTCPSTTLPYSEDFTSQTIGYSPQCWQVNVSGTSTNWIVDDYNYAGGITPQLTFIPYSNYFSGRSYLSSPVINTEGQASLNLEFKQYINAYSAASSCEVWTTSDGGTTWNSVWSVAQNGQMGPLTSNFSITTSDVGSSTFQFAFAVNGNSWEIGSWQIDDIILTGVPQTGTLQGVVTACSNAGLLSGVTVTAGANTTTTDEYGFYQFLNIPAALYDVSYSLADYVTKTITGVQVLDGQATTQDACLAPAGPPVTATLQNITISGGPAVCYDATQTITVAGSGTTFVVENPGSVTMIAGISIDYLPGTWVKAGGYLLGKIAPAGPFCGMKEATIVTAEGGGDLKPMLVEKATFKVYPNPTTGKFRLEMAGQDQPEIMKVDIYGLRGEKVLSETSAGEAIHEYSLSDLPAGIYFIKVVAGDRTYTSKLVKTR
ncbi:MAG: carboxypeptidase regulatory-like domain-containing protein [Bacteroidales bacterium]